MRTLYGLGSAAHALHHYEAAQQAFSRALQLAEAAGFHSLILQALTGECGLLVSSNQLELAAELLVCILRHPATDRETSDAAQALLVRCATARAPDILATATLAGQALALDHAVARLGMNPARIGAVPVGTNDVGQDA